MREKCDSPKVAVAVPSLNVAEYIDECLYSLTHQTFYDIEIFVVDAGSTDGTREIIEKYAKDDGRITLLDDDKKSTGYSKNLVIDKAKAPYYAIVEADDYIDVRMLERLYETAVHYDTDIVKCGYDTFVGDKHERFFFPKNAENGTGLAERTIMPSKENKAFRWAMYEWLGLYKVSFLRKYNIRHNETRGAAFQDIGFWFLSFSYAKKVMLIGDVGYHYRIDNPNSSINNTDKIFDTCVEYEYIRAELKSDERLWDMVSGAFWREYFHSNEAVFKVLDEALRAVLSDKMRNDLLHAKKSGEIKWEYFEADEKKNINALLDSQKSFLAEYRKNRERGFSLKKEIFAFVGDCDVIIFGAGFYGANLQYLFRENGIMIEAFADNDTKKQKSLLNDMEVLSPKECKKRYPAAKWIITNMRHSREMREELVSVIGIYEENIFICDVDMLCVRLY